jgi:chromosome segregation ATPase
LDSANSEIKRLGEVEARARELGEKVADKDAEMLTQSRFAEEKVKQELGKRAEAEADSESLRQQIELWKSGKTILEATIAELKEKNSEQNTELRKLRATIEDHAQDTARQVQNAIRDSEKSRDQQLQQLRVQVEEKENELSELKKKEWESKDTETQRLYKKISEFEGKLEARNSAANEFRKQAMEYQKELSESLDKVREIIF